MERRVVRTALSGNAGERYRNDVTIATRSIVSSADISTLKNASATLADRFRWLISMSCLKGHTIGGPLTFITLLNPKSLGAVLAAIDGPRYSRNESRCSSKTCMIENERGPLQHARSKWFSGGAGEIPCSHNKVSIPIPLKR